VRISQVSAFQIFDSRGNPTVEAEVVLDCGARGRGLVPSGTSKGSLEALELRDGNPKQFGGKSVEKAVAQVNGEIARTIRGMDAGEPADVDRALIELDGTPNKSRLGANATLAVSMAVANAAATAKKKPLFESLGGEEANLLPLPEIQIFGGGAHANHATDVQDFLVVAMGARTYFESLEISFNVYRAAKDVLQERKKYFGVADEGGYWPEFSTNEDVLDALLESIYRSGYSPGKDVAISLDIAASEFFDHGTRKYYFRRENREFSSRQFISLMCRWCERYPIISLEDPMAETDWEGWKQTYVELGRTIQLVGDDLFCTNVQRISIGMDEGVANAVLIKPNQIGTVTETISAIRLVQSAGWLPIVSARSGETEDVFISHLAVGTNAGQLKVGSIARGERTAKWNELLRIERALGRRARFQGAAMFETLRRQYELRNIEQYSRPSTPP
jgi:enolase